MKLAIISIVILNILFFSHSFPYLQNIFSHENSFIALLMWSTLPFSQWRSIQMDGDSEILDLIFQDLFDDDNLDLVGNTSRIPLINLALV